MVLRPWMDRWPKGVAQSLSYPEISLGEVLHRSATQFPNKTAVYYSDNEITFQELDSLADRFGEVLQDLGVRKGERVAIYLPNLPQFVFAYYGALRVGAIVVAVSPLYKERELAHILCDSGAKVLICWDKLYPYVQAVRNNTKVSDVIRTDSYLDSSDADNLKELLAKYHGSPKPVKIEPRKDLALLQYTGGTTGIPKGAMLTHYNLVVNTVQFSTWLRMTPSREVHLSVLPFFHIYGMTVAMNGPIYTSSPMILIPDTRDITAILRAIDKYKPTIFCGVPAMYIALIDQPDIQQHNLRSIRACVSGASPLPIQVQRRFEELTGGRLVEGYGLTETSPVTHVNPLDVPDKNRPGSIGIPISDTEAKIVGLETGYHDLPPGTPGELVVRGPQVMMGYWNNPEETKMALRDGWLHTGDIATMDPDGYFRIVDRKKDMINVSGLKVWPREVEEVLYEHPSIKEAAVVAVPDPTSGDAVKAFVILKDNYKGRTTASEIIAFCKEKVAEYKAPKIVEFRDTLPKSSVGKILRRELKPQHML
jgi:long-chain acyl-CoA synthetase